MLTPSTDATHAVDVRRTFRATPERLFKLWTTPTDLIACFNLTSAEVDLRPGGRYTWVFSNPDGSDDPAVGTFREIDRPHRLVFTWIAACPAGTTGETWVTVTFHPLDSASTEVRIHHDRLPNAAVANDHRGGWTSCLAGIASHLGED